MARIRLITGLTAATAGLAVATPAQADIVIGPRFSYYFDNSNTRSSDLTGVGDGELILDEEFRAFLEDQLGEPVTVVETPFNDALLAEQIVFPMIGGMVNFGNDRDRFTLTAMVGSGSGAVELISTRFVQVDFSQGQLRDLEARVLSGGTRVDRLDVEATWQRRLSENFALTGGIRYERLDRQDEANFFADASSQIFVYVEDDPSLLLRFLPGEYAVAGEATVETYTARLGGTAFVPIDDSINAFFSGMAQIGYTPETEQSLTYLFPEGSFAETDTLEGEWSAGPDMAIGLQFVLAQNLALDVRYRAIVFFPLSGAYSFDDARVNHGVNVGLSLRL